MRLDFGIIEFIGFVRVPDFGVDNPVKWLQQIFNKESIRKESNQYNEEKNSGCEKSDRKSKVIDFAQAVADFEYVIRVLVSEIIIKYAIVAFFVFNNSGFIDESTFLVYEIAFCFVQLQEFVV